MPQHTYERKSNVCKYCYVRRRWWCVRMLLFHRICIYDEIQTRHGQLRTYQQSIDRNAYNIVRDVVKWHAIKFDFLALSYFLCHSSSLSFIHENAKMYGKCNNKKLRTCLKAKCSPMLIVKPAKITQPINVRDVPCHIWKKKKPFWWSSKGFILSIFFFHWNGMDSGDKSLDFMQWVFRFRCFFFLYSHKSGKIIEHFISKWRKMTTNNRHMIIMTLSVHDLIAFIHVTWSSWWKWKKRQILQKKDTATITEKTRMNELCAKQPKFNEIWWDRWNDNNCCYCLHFEIETFSIFVQFVHRFWIEMKEMRDRQKNDTYTNKSVTALNLNDNLCDARSGNLNHIIVDCVVVQKCR